MHAWRTLATFATVASVVVVVAATQPRGRHDAASPMPAAALGYIDGPPPAHTGGFDEPTCHACHFENDVDADGGALTIDAPATYVPGRRYALRIEVRHPALKRGGFEVSTRFAAGPARGAQAGELHVPAEVGRVTVQEEVAYAHHVRAGTEMSTAGVAAWTIEWTAPAQGAADVAVHVAANAANDDNSEFGDHIYTARATIAAAADFSRQRTPPIAKTHSTAKGGAPH